MKSIICSIKKLASRYIAVATAATASLGSMVSILPVQAAGLLTPAGTQTPLEIRTQSVNVRIQDGFAMTTVEQVFAHPSIHQPEEPSQASQTSHGEQGSLDSKTAYDAHYQFPVPEKASVSQFTYWIDGQPIHGEVVEKEKAKEIYQQEKQAGRKVAVTEQESFLHFDIKVAQIPAGQDARIKLVYYQPIEIDHGVGRYVYPLEEGGTDSEQSAFWTRKSEVQQQFSFHLELLSGHPVDAVRVPNVPQALIQQFTSQHWQVSLDSQVNTAAPQQPAFKLNEDIVFYWRLPEGTPGSLNVVAYKPEPTSGHKMGTVMMTLTPADDLKPIVEGTDWTLVLDISGSMKGKFQTLVEGVSQGLSKFKPQDRVRIILFNNGVQPLSRGYVQATPENLIELANKLSNITPSGGTNLMAGIRMGLDDMDEDRTSAIWLVTDGVANVGETNQRAFLKLLKDHDIRLFTFIMGNGANKPLLQALSKASNGFALAVSNADDILGKLEMAASKVSYEALHDVKVKFKGLKVRDVQPSTIGSLYRGQQLQIFGHYWKGGEGELVVTGKRSGQDIEYRLPITLPEADIRYPELERLWAFAEIQTQLDDQRTYGDSDDRRDAVVDLAKTYGLVTPYTSMLVLEQSQFQRYGIEQKNAVRIEQEVNAQTKRKDQGIQNHQQASSHSALSGSRSSLGSGGSADWKWLVLLAMGLYSRRKLKKVMS